MTHARTHIHTRIDTHTRSSCQARCKVGNRIDRLVFYAPLIICRPSFCHGSGPKCGQHSFTLTGRRARDGRGRVMWAKGLLRPFAFAFALRQPPAAIPPPSPPPTTVSPLFLVHFHFYISVSFFSFCFLI